MSSALFFPSEHRDKIFKSFFFNPSFQFSRIFRFVWIKRHLVWLSFLLVGAAHYPTHLRFPFCLWCCTCVLFLSFFSAVLGLCCCRDFSLVAENRGYSAFQYPGVPSLWLLWLWSSVPGFPFAVASLVVELSTRVSHRCGFSGCDSWPLQSTGSVVVLNGLSCSSVCGIFLDQGWNPCPLHWQVNSLPLSHRGSRSYAFWMCFLQFRFYCFYGHLYWF